MQDEMSTEHFRGTQDTEMVEMSVKDQEPASRLTGNRLATPTAVARHAPVLPRLSVPTAHRHFRSSHRPFPPPMDNKMKTPTAYSILRGYDAPRPLSLI